MSAEFARVFRRLIRPFDLCVKLMIGRAVLHVLDDDRKLQAVQVQALAGEVLDNVERFQQYGFSGSPHPGAECVLLSLGGMRQHPIVVAIDDRRFRPSGLSAGEVVIYTSQDPEEAHRIWLKNGHTIRIDANDDVSLELSPDHIRAEKGSDVTLELTSDHIRAEKTDEVTLELTSDHIVAEIDPSGQMATPSRITLESDHVLIEKDATTVEITDSAVDITGDVNITGTLDVTGDIEVSGDVDGVDVSTHRHGGVMSGGSNTGPPV